MTRRRSLTLRAPLWLRRLAFPGIQVARASLRRTRATAIVHDRYEELTKRTVSPVTTKVAFRAHSLASVAPGTTGSASLSPR